MPELMLVLLILTCVSSLFRWPESTTFHDPISAIVATVAEVVSAVAPEALGATAAATGAEVAGASALGAGALGAADIVLPEVVATAAAPALAGGAGIVGDLAIPAVAGLGATEALSGVTGGVGSGGGTGGAVDVGGGGAGSSSFTPVADAAGVFGQSLTPSAGAGSLTSNIAPVSGASSLSSAATPSLASVPAQVTTDPLAGVTGTGGDFAGGGSGASTVSGPVGGSTTGGWGAGGEFLGETTTSAGAGGPSSSGGLLNKLGLSGVGDFFKDNKDLLGVASAAASPIMSLIQGDPLSQFKQLGTANSLAATEANVGGGLTSAALNGVLAPGFEDAVTRSKMASDARTVGRYSDLGVSGSTAEAADLGANNANVEAQRATLLQDMLKQGMSATGIAEGHNLDLAKLAIAQDDEMQRALATLAGSLMKSTVS